MTGADNGGAQGEEPGVSHSQGEHQAIGMVGVPNARAVPVKAAALEVTETLFLPDAQGIG